MNRQRLVDRAVKRWAVAALEPSKGSNVDVLDVIDRFNEHANSQLAGISVSEARLLSAIEEELKGAKVDKTAGRIEGIHWKKIKLIVYEPIPTRDKRDLEIEVRFTAFLNQGSVFVQRGEKGFSTAAFANWRDSWLTSAGAQIRHDTIGFDDAQSWLESRPDLVELRDDKLWYIVSRR